MAKKRYIVFEVKTLSNLCKRKLFEFEPPPNDEEFTDVQGQTIDFLYQNFNKKDVFQKDIEEKFSIRRSTVSRLLQQMERKGVLTRESVPYDARLKKIVMTQKAIENHERIRKRIEEIETLVSKGLTKEEMNTFFAIVDKIKKNVL